MPQGAQIDKAKVVEGDSERTKVAAQVADGSSEKHKVGAPQGENELVTATTTQILGKSCEKRGLVAAQTFVSDSKVGKAASVTVVGGESKVVKVSPSKIANGDSKVGRAAAAQLAAVRRDELNAPKLVRLPGTETSSVLKAGVTLHQRAFINEIGQTVGVGYSVESDHDLTFCLDLTGSTNIELVEGGGLVRETGVMANTRTFVGEFTVKDQSQANIKYTRKSAFRIKTGLPVAAAGDICVEEAVRLPPTARCSSFPVLLPQQYFSFAR
jgi:hypothetical protein